MEFLAAFRLNQSFSKMTIYALPLNKSHYFSALSSQSDRLKNILHPESQFQALKLCLAKIQYFLEYIPFVRPSQGIRDVFHSGMVIACPDNLVIFTTLLYNRLG
jgi:hypothetical protein